MKIKNQKSNNVMRCALYITYLLGFFFILSNFFMPQPANAQNNKTDVLFFYATGCSHCENVKPFIKDFEEKNSDKADVHWFNVQESDESRSLFMKYLNKYYATSSGVPSVFIGDKLIQGDSPIKAGLISALSNCSGECQLKIALDDAIDKPADLPSDKKTNISGEKTNNESGDFKKSENSFFTFRNIILIFSLLAILSVVIWRCFLCKKRGD